MKDVYRKRPEARNTGSPFDLLITAREIGEAMGISEVNFHRNYRDRMVDYGLCWKHGQRHNSPYASSRYFINIFFYLEAKRKLKKKLKRGKKNAR